MAIGDTVGIQTNNSQLDTQITQVAVALRNVCQQIKNLNTQVNGGGSGTTWLEGVGYTPTGAAEFAQLLGYLNNISGVYYGDATVNADFDFDNALSDLWGNSI